MNIEPEKSGSEIMPTEPYLLGSHSGCCGIWVSGPDEEWVPAEYKIKADNGKVYNRMTTVNGLFTCADGVGASGHKFSSGSHAEGRIVGKQMVRWCVDHKDYKPSIAQRDRRRTQESSSTSPGTPSKSSRVISTDPVINPKFISPKNFMMRLIKCTDEYGGGCATLYTTSKSLLDTGFKLLQHDGRGFGQAGGPRPARAHALLGAVPPPVDRSPAHDSTSPSVRNPATPASTTAAISPAWTTPSGSAS